MNGIRNAAVLLLAATASLSFASPPAANRRVDEAPDVTRRGQRAARVATMAEMLSAGGPSNEEVGDGDSFSRPVKFLGFAQTDFVSIAQDCTGSDPARCTAVTDPRFTATISYIGDEAVIHLPARAAKSLLCFNLTPLGNITILNSSGSLAEGLAIMGARWRIESEVLNDPTLINPATGLPFGGVLPGGASLDIEQRTIADGEYQTFYPLHSRGCISGHLSRRSLVGMGLSDAQAREVFRKPMTIRFGSSAFAQYAIVDSAVGVRIYGD
jgi:hypothetical protein